ncbi:Hypothetical protein LUCI_1783 [Lucifera butyrica]|uniref:Uncharacterized protein n=1 Tax=Lucifera butyrica TaxID=1351585 RepID=A0A498R6N3_9FIRM|nr:hypothetical protein [Lucifera butyrica]VBB06547.1 Hypothetical protein LUCI_1783 [Lucifera butyrica]
MAKVTVKETEYKQYGKCVSVSNGVVDLVATVDCGPRIIRFGITGQENEFCEHEGAKETYGGKFWHIRGGHRLWHSPEHDPRSYIADNDPVEYHLLENGVHLVQKPEEWVQIQKEMTVTLAAGSNQVTVTHKLINKNAWPVELAVWALTVMAPGGREVVPQPSRDTGLLGNRLLALWPYSKMNDHRIYWGEKMIALKQDPKMQPPFKFGIPNEDGWAAYFNHGNLFIKRYQHQLDAKYPDFGVSYETYTTDFMLEMESLSPLVRLEPGASASHAESWELIPGVGTPAQDEAGLLSLLSKYTRKT